MVKPRFFTPEILDPEKMIPEAYYSDDIWFSGHLAKTRISRIVFPSTYKTRLNRFPVCNEKYRLGAAEDKNARNNEAVLEWFKNYW